MSTSDLCKRSQNEEIFFKKNQSTRFCVTYKLKVDNTNRVNIDLKNLPKTSTTREEERNSYNNGDNSSKVKADVHNEKNKGKMIQVDVDGEDYDAITMIYEKENREKMANLALVEIVKKGDLFRNKTFLMKGLRYVQ